MSKICSICNKTLSTGHNVSHSKRRTKRTWSPNLTTTTITENGRRRKIVVCTRCLKTLSKPQRGKK
ncbi:TPA: 50S ribosomal protein L28 [Patescibacteria group bacterium]|uniref:Large ribosomal subunit protein bL28 n=1 Tax=candidate division Kazan bacterium GW2011_GWA1_50_15 TaxID=1620412 RepID=A0A0G4BBU0_UNCK3|nr:MAG: 50S ribosomal protein L28, large subunit ribosomal protein L28 [candidate division Kazan bacterium GW2011_GWA1_50_15]HCL47389.1 50S ribosomal protein L28 [Patescibacteria group bacterium]HCR42394.1 50S ribosomal protein L28 [Patescibacteria group bacterium]